MLKALRYKSERAGPNVLLEGSLTWPPSPHCHKTEDPLGWDREEVAGRDPVLDCPNKVKTTSPLETGTTQILSVRRLGESYDYRFGIQMYRSNSFTKNDSSFRLLSNDWLGPPF